MLLHRELFHMKNLANCACILLLSSLAIWAVAEEDVQRSDEEQSIEDEFTTMDSDEDGKVSRREYVAYVVSGLRESQGLEQDRVSNTDPEELREAIGQRFDAVDTNSDDMWTIDEITKANTVSREESGSSRERMFEALDADGNDEVTLDEFTQAFLRRLQGRVATSETEESTTHPTDENLKQRLEQRFNAADKNDDGILTPDELR